MWRTRRAWHRALFVRFATLPTLSLEHSNLNHLKLGEVEAPTLDATSLRQVLRGVGLSVPNSTSLHPMLAEFGEVAGYQPRLTYTQFQTPRTSLNTCGERSEADLSLGLGSGKGGKGGTGGEHGGADVSLGLGGRAGEHGEADVSLGLGGKGGKGGKGGEHGEADLALGMGN